MQGIKDVTFSALRKNLLASASDDGSVCVWDVNTRTVFAPFRRAHKAPASGVCFSSVHGLLLCSAGLDKKIAFYDIKEKK